MFGTREPVIHHLQHQHTNLYGIKLVLSSQTSIQPLHNLTLGNIDTAATSSAASSDEDYYYTMPLSYQSLNFECNPPFLLCYNQFIDLDKEVSTV